MRLVIAGATDVGRVRDGNEDGYLIDEPIGLVAIADGMGGHRAGEVASATALEALRAAVHSGRPIGEAVAAANDAVFFKSLTDKELAGMGTTLTAATLAADDTFLVGHVGDSRAYLLRDGAFQQLTIDHSRVQEMVEDGQLTAEEAAVHPMRNIVTRAIGVDSRVQVDVYSVDLHPGDRVLFCSDGLTDMLPDDAVAAELGREADPARVATQLVDAANRAGGVDNITVVIIDITDGDAVREPAPQSEPVVETIDWSADSAAAPVRETPSSSSGIGRAVLWTLPVLLVVGVALGALGWYARRTYYVAAERGRVTLYQGVPGGLLWWNATVHRRTKLRVADLLPVDAADVRDEHTFSSAGDADSYLRRIRARATSPTSQTTTTSTTTTTTTTTTGPTTTTATSAP